MVTVTMEQFGLIRTVSGVVSTEEMDRSAKEIQSHPGLDEMKYNIHDFTGLVEAKISDGDIAYMAARANVSVERNPKLKIVFVGTHPTVYAMMNAFNGVGYSRHRVVRFDTLNEARAYVAA